MKATEQYARCLATHADGPFTVEGIVLDRRPLLRLRDLDGTWLGDYPTPDAVAAVVDLTLVNPIERTPR